MERELATLGKGVRCCSWNYCGKRLAVGYNDGSVEIHDSDSFSSSSTFSRSSKWTVHASSIMNIIWIPPDFGDAIACICVDGTLSLWEEAGEDAHSVAWKKCAVFESSGPRVLEVQFGFPTKYLKMVVAYSDGHVKVYELLDMLELNKWQLQADFKNVVDSVSVFGKPTCTSASIAWSPRRGGNQQSGFVLGFSSDLPQFNSCKMWEFEEPHQRWLPVAELALPEDRDDRVHALAWAPNIGRPFEVIAVATCKGIAIWHVWLESETDQRLSSEKIAVLSGHVGEVWQLEWDICGMTLASTGGDGMVRLWQSNLNGVWHEHATLDCGGGKQ